MIRSIALAAVAAASVLFAGCAGGGGSTSPVPHAAASLAPSSPESSANTISIRIPRPSASSASNTRKAAFVSAAANSVAVTLSYSNVGGPVAYQHVFDIATDCPISGGYAICTVALSSIATPPPATSNTSILSVVAQALTGSNGTGTLLATTLPSAGCQNAFATSTASCAIVLAGVVSSMTVTQAAPIVIGSTSSVGLTASEFDPSGAQLTDSNMYASCLAFSDASEAWVGDTAAADPNITLAGVHPYDGTGGVVVGGVSQPATNCFDGSGAELQFLDTPSDSYSLTSNGSAALPTQRNFQLLSVVGGGFTNPAAVAPWSAGNGISYRPLTVPSSRVVIAGVAGAPQTLVVPVPPGYASPVSLAVSNCLTSSASTNGTAQGSNTAASPLVSVMPASVTPASPGASVSFQVSPTGANTGTCWLTSSADATNFGAVVSW